MSANDPGGPVECVVRRLSEQLRSDHASGDFGRALEGYAERAEALEQEIERLRKDAERYRWLRDANGVEWEGAIDTLVCAYRPEVIDEAIDRAMVVAARRSAAMNC